MIRDPIGTLLSLGMYSAYLKNDQSVSIILIADPESNKTRQLMRLSKSPKTKVQTDLTYYGLVNELLPLIEKGDIFTVIIPDMLKPITKKQSTRSNFITILNSLIEEGVFNVTIRDEKNFHGARANVLSSVTPAIFRDNRTMFHRMGFWTRVIPFTYKYSPEKIEDIFERIGDYSASAEEPIKIESPFRPVEVKITKEQTEEAERLARLLAKAEEIRHKRKRKDKEYEWVEDSTPGFRHKWQFMSLIKASALKREIDAGRTYLDGIEVTDEDLATVRDLSQWINYDFRELG